MSDAPAEIRSAIEAAEAGEPDQPPPPEAPRESAEKPKKSRRSPALAGQDGGDASPPGEGGAFSVDEINREFALVLMGSRAVVVRQSDDGPIDDRQRVLTTEAFQTWFGNRFLETMTPRGAKKITWANAWLQHPLRRQYEGVEFFPDPDNAPGTARRLNLWRGFAFAPAPKPNGYSVFRDHLLNQVCDGDAALFRWVFAFFAHIVQRPRERVGVALVLRGGMGTGKSVVGEHFGALFPSHYFLVDDPRYVTGQFNAHMASCLLLEADEAVWAGDKTAEGRLKGLVTSPVQQIEAKGVDPIRLANYVRLIMTSNEQWVVPAGRDERRFCVLDVNPRCAGAKGYFGEMRAQLKDGGYAALLADLLAFDLEAVDLRTIPKTKALLDQKERSLESVQGWWLTRLSSGRAPAKRHEDDDYDDDPDAPGWGRQIRKDELYADYVEESERTGVRRRREPTIFGRELGELAPGLRSARPITSSGRRPRVYLLPTLAECRAAWDERMGQQRDWKSEDGDDD